jgi:hypothetical protein
MKPTPAGVLCVAALALLALGPTAGAWGAIAMTGSASGGSLVLIPNNPGSAATGVLKLKFGAPQAGGSLAFCIGPASNPCGHTSSLVVRVPGGEERLLVVNAGVFFSGNVLAVNNPTSTRLPYTVTVE